MLIEKVVYIANKPYVFETTNLQSLDYKNASSVLTDEGILCFTYEPVVFVMKLLFNSVEMGMICA